MVVTSILSLSELGLETIRLFKRVKRIDKYPDQKTADEWPKDLFEAQSDRFELWAVNLGLFVSGHGSLDYRLREAERLEATVRRFIGDLNDSLSDILGYCADGQSGFNDVIDYEVDEASLQSTDHLATSDNNSIEEGDENDIDVLLDSVKDPIDRLFKVSTRIRNPSSRLGSSKALRHAQIDLESGVDFLQVAEKFDYDYVSSMFLQYQKSKSLDEEATCKPQVNIDDEDNLVWDPIRSILSQNCDEIATGKENFLVRRVALANTRRRQQFGYWKHHKSKLADHAQVSTLSIEILDNAANDHETAEEIVFEQQTDELPFPGPFIPLQSVTTATLLNVEHILSNNDARSTISVSEYAPSAWQPGKEVVDFPPAPKNDPDDKFFECPYCFTLCSTEVLSDKAWKAHLIHDLRPYMCTYEACRNSQQMYDNRKDWIFHENSHRTVWQCSEHPTYISDRIDDYREHLKMDHPDCSNERILHSHIQASETIPEAADRCCPVCSLQLQSARSIHSHVALHLERFSLFALPRSVEQEGDDSYEADSDRVNTTSEGSRDDDFGSESSYENSVSGDYQSVDSSLMNDLCFGEDDRVPIGSDREAYVARWEEPDLIANTKVMLHFWASTPAQTFVGDMYSETLFDQRVNTRVIADTLKGKKPVKTIALTGILPRLPHSGIMDLRHHYKDLVRIGPENKGVDMVKHIRLRLRGSANISNVAYATALGKWESEVFWITEWKLRNLREEFLFESLLGRTKQEIREIKNAFRGMQNGKNTIGTFLDDNIHDDHLKRLMMLVLNESQLTQNRNGGRELVARDAGSIRHYIDFQNGNTREVDNSELVVEIMVRRTDRHLRAVLDHYAAKIYATRFKKVSWGEQNEDSSSKTPVHRAMDYIFSGLINRPKRDAEAIFHTLSKEPNDITRADLLTSRLVRYHWDIPHMAMVKAEYSRQYGIPMKQAVADGTHGDWGRFCEVLCEEIPEPSLEAAKDKVE